PSHWRTGRDRHRSPRCRGSPVAARHLQVRIAAAGSRDWSGPAPEWTAEYRPLPCASALPQAEAQRWSSSSSSAAMLAASNSRLASRATAIRRSEQVIPRSLAESNAMLSWRGATDSTAVAGEFFMLLLLDDGRIVPGASSETALDQQLMQLSQRRQLDARRTERHSRAGGRVEHPCRDHDDY